MKKADSIISTEACEIESLNNVNDKVEVMVKGGKESILVFADIFTFLISTTIKRNGQHL